MLMDKAMLELDMLATGSTQAWGPDVALRGKMVGESQMPTGDGNQEVDQLAWDYYFATTHRARLRVILEAQEMARRIKKLDRGLIKGTLEWKRAIAEDERPYTVLQRVWSISPNTVSTIKREHGAG
jgi:hypothetical protein